MAHASPTHPYVAFHPIIVARYPHEAVLADGQSIRRLLDKLGGSMHKTGAGAVTEDIQGGLLDLAAVRLQVLLSDRDAAASSTLDSVMQRLFDPRDREKLTVSAFGSSL